MNENTFINLNEIFQNAYDYNSEEFFSQPFIELEAMGKRKKFWFYYNGNKFLFKKVSNNLYEAYGEILSQSIAKVMDIPCARYMLAKFDYENDQVKDFKDSVGIITPSFLKKREKLVPIGEIISQVLMSHIRKDKKTEELYDVDLLKDFTAVNKMNNIEDLWAVLDIYFKDYSNKQEIVEYLMKELVKIYFFDLITLQGDRNIWNFGVILGPNQEVRMAPVFDNSNIYNLNRPRTMIEFQNLTKSKKRYIADKNAKVQKGIFNALYHSKLRFSGNADDFLKRDNIDKKKKQLESLQNFLSKSDSETIDLLEHYVTTLKEYGIQQIIMDCEEMQGYTFPEEFREYFITSMNMNLDNLENVLEERKDFRR